MANRDLTVIASGGDGDGFAIGMGHTIHALRRNIDITYIVMDNQVYGLTKGQTSPRSIAGFVTKSSPKGSIERPISPLELAIASGATFVAQGFSSDVKELVSLIEAGVKHQGFSFINVFSPCVTYNKVNTYDWFRENLTKVEKIEGFDPTDRKMAMEIVMQYDGLLTGVIYHDPASKSYQDLLPGYKEAPLAKGNIHLSQEEFQSLMEEFI